MGTDNIFRKRQGKRRNELERRKAVKETKPLYLIVCEGKKSEPLYFEEMRNHERISTVKIRVTGECGSAPISVVNHALELYSSLLSDGEQVEVVYCVFDRDNHESYYRALALVSQKNKEGVPLVSIASIPCFEYWVILHYRYHRSPYERKDKSSVSADLCKELQQYMPYKKGGKGLYESLKSKQGDALKNAKKAVEDYGATGQENPVTYVHELVEELIKYSSI
ncbi:MULTISPECIES: RloB family protein [Pseudomonas]|nr:MULTISPECIES: RloB family protein [Pseudomonas]EKP5710842.1 RloB domain-containing protein [Pseudomonas aeruginosa]EKV8092257.1 RloB domain-containing protein [Pseudomonas aeruginosa]EKW5159348.1 RloB domain-containing protein [Pseudomonas aeruginosa]EKW6388657.1 RloB domain-containing protein [Pseudomonas aeruginosa]EKW6421405.1 RloB domain-containing protein [Pseudomonas aeruginosa]